VLAELPACGHKAASFPLAFEKLNFKSRASQNPVVRAAAMWRSTDVENDQIPEARAAGDGR